MKSKNATPTGPSPTHIQVKWEGEKVHISWEPVAGATSYDIECISDKLDFVSAPEPSHRFDQSRSVLRIRIRAVFGVEVGVWSRQWTVRRSPRLALIVLGIVIATLLLAIVLVVFARCEPTPTPGASTPPPSAPTATPTASLTPSPTLTATPGPTSTPTVTPAGPALATQTPEAPVAATSPPVSSTLEDSADQSGSPWIPALAATLGVAMTIVVTLKRKAARV